MMLETVGCTQLRHRSSGGGGVQCAPSPFLDLGPSPFGGGDGPPSVAPTIASSTSACSSEWAATGIATFASGSNFLRPQLSAPFARAPSQPVPATGSAGGMTRAPSASCVGGLQRIASFTDALARHLGISSSNETSSASPAAAPLSPAPVGQRLAAAAGLAGGVGESDAGQAVCRVRDWQANCECMVAALEAAAAGDESLPPGSRAGAAAVGALWRSFAVSLGQLLGDKAGGRKGVFFSGIASSGKVAAQVSREARAISHALRQLAAEPAAAPHPATPPPSAPPSASASPRAPGSSSDRSDRQALSPRPPASLPSAHAADGDKENAAGGAAECCPADNAGYELFRSLVMSLHREFEVFGETKGQSRA